MRVMNIKAGIAHIYKENLKWGKSLRKHKRLHKLVIIPLKNVLILLHPLK